MYGTLPDNELQLFHRVAAGDEIAYTELFHLFTPRIFPYLFKITKDEELAREFLQETFLKLWIHRGELPQIEKPAAWLFRIAANLCLSYLRSRASRISREATFGEQGAEVQTPEGAFDQKQTGTLISAAIHALPDRRRQVWTLVRENGWSHQQVADHLQISVHTVRNQLSTAVESIRIYLQQHSGLTIATIVILMELKK